ncbi:hypothetical protein [Salinicoccus luteus]|uniref:hypothetical protein n=1 Tax=Salinicoccus luteus TaxID=367840 RepID=UPI0004E1A916|nr:hypothetical protein [Salinicoccus luteus]
MKTIKLSDMRKTNAERREKAIRAVRRINPEFVPGMRSHDRARINSDKQKILEEMQERENDL